MRRANHSGFTLIELLIAVLIIGILAAIALPALNGARERAKDQEAKQTLEYGLRAAKAVYTEGEAFPGPDSTALATLLGRAERSTSFAAGTGFPASAGTVHVQRVSASRVTLRALSRTGNQFLLATDEAAAQTVRSGGSAAAGGLSPSVNVISNPSFENGMTGWINNNGPPTLASSAVNPYSGSSVMRVVADNANQGGYWAFTSVPGQTYTFSAWVRPVVGAARLTAWSASSSSVLTARAHPSSLNSSGRWTKLSITFTADGASSRAIIESHLPGAGEFYADLTTVVTGSQPGTFDGDSPGAEWTGAPHASPSSGYLDGAGW